MRSIKNWRFSWRMEITYYFWFLSSIQCIVSASIVESWGPFGLLISPSLVSLTMGLVALRFLTQREATITMLFILISGVLAAFVVAFFGWPIGILDILIGNFLYFGHEEAKSPLSF